MGNLFPRNLAESAMTLRIILVAALSGSLAACAIPPQSPVYRLLPSDDTAAVRLDELARIAELSPEQRRRETNELDATRRLSSARRFQLAALLEREDDVESLERSLKLLGALNDRDARSDALLDLMKRSLRTRIDARQQAARNQELQNKLEQIKALEKSLQQRATPTAP